MTDSPPTPKKVKLDDDDVENMTKEDLLEKFKEQEKYIKFLEEKQKLRTSEGGEDFEMKESEEKLKQQHIEAARRENTLVLRLTTKEQELQDYLNQIQEFKAAQTPSTNQLRSMLLDPAINLVFQHMAKEMEECKERQKQTQNELSAWKFTADRCIKTHLLYSENMSSLLATNGDDNGSNSRGDDDSDHNDGNSTLIAVIHIKTPSIASKWVMSFSLPRMSVFREALKEVAGKLSSRDMFWKCALNSQLILHTITSAPHLPLSSFL